MSHTGKYFGAPASDGQKVFWPGANGYPVRTNTPTSLRDAEFDEIETEYDYKVRIFKLPADIDDFVAIKDKIINGLYMGLKEELRFIEADASFLVYLEWVEIYGRPPTPARRNPDFSR